MNILLVSLNFFPELTGIGVYSYGFAKYLAEHGMKVEVLTTFPYYPEWKKHEGYPRNFFLSEKIGSISVQRYFTYVPKVPSSLKRILHEAIFSTLIFFRMIFCKKPSLIISVSPPFLAMVVSACIAHLRKIPLHLHIQDLQPDAAIGLGMLKGETLQKFLYFLELFSYKSATLISAISMGMVSRIRSKGIDQNKLLLFSNWADLENIVQLERGGNKENVFRKAHKLDDKFIVLYSGNIGEKQGIDTLIETAQIAQQMKDDIQFIISGDGARRPHLEQRANQLQLSNIRFFDVQSKETFLDMLMAANISVILQRKEVKDIVVPSKLLNILNIGSPVIAAVHFESETARILKDLSIDVLVEPENPEALYIKIKYFRNSCEMIERLKKEEKELAKSIFAKEKILSEVKSRIEEIVFA